MAPIWPLNTKVSVNNEYRHIFHTFLIFSAQALASRTLKGPSQSCKWAVNHRPDPFTDWRRRLIGVEWWESGDILDKCSAKIKGQRFLYAHREQRRRLDVPRTRAQSLSLSRSESFISSRKAKLKEISYLWYWIQSFLLHKRCEEWI